MSTLSNIFAYAVEITGFLVFIFAGLALTLMILDYTVTSILKRFRAWVIIVEYVFKRKEFKRWLKIQDRENQS